MTDIVPLGGPNATDVGTNWNRYGLEQIWAMVRTEDGEVTFRQIDAWNKMAALCDEQANQLEGALAQLLQRWPARPGSAAEAFSAYVKEFIASIKEAATAAAAIREPLQRISTTLAVARGEIGALFEQQRKSIAFETAAKNAAIPNRPGIDPAPAAAPVGLLGEDWRATLDEHAQSVMAAADSVVARHAEAIRPPNRYDAPSIQYDHIPIGEAPGPQGVGVANSLSQIPRPSFDAIAALPSNHLSPSPSYDHLWPTLDEPVLDGASASTQLANTLPSQRTLDIPRADTEGLMDSANANRGTVSILGPVLGPGGVIGAQKSTTPGPVRAVVASGGVVHEASPPSGRAAGQGTSVAPMVPAPSARPGAGLRNGASVGGRLGARRRHGHGSKPSADDPWAIADGVPGVIEPLSAATEHNPGPGVIGVNG